MIALLKVWAGILSLPGFYQNDQTIREVFVLSFLKTSSAAEFLAFQTSSAAEWDEGHGTWQESVRT